MMDLMCNGNAKQIWMTLIVSENCKLHVKVMIILMILTFSRVRKLANWCRVFLINVDKLFAMHVFRFMWFGIHP